MTEARPPSILWFERLSLASLLLGLINVVVDPTSIWPFVIFSDGITITLILLVSRGRKNWARWVLGTMFALGFIFMIWQFRALMAEAIPLVTLGVTVLQIVGLIMLFTPQSSAWFRNRKSLADTFS